MASIGDVLKFVEERAYTYHPDTTVAVSRAANTNTSDSAQADESIITDRPPEKVRVDVVVIVALSDPELKQLWRVFGERTESYTDEGVIYSAFWVPVKGIQLRVVAAVQTDMGMIPAAVLTSKAIRSWQPTLVAMVGICAGVKGKLSLGDVVVARQVFDYGSGKIVEGKLLPDYQPIILDDLLTGCAMDLANDAAVMAEIRAGWPLSTGKPKTDLELHVGAMASGAAVVANDTVVDGIQEHKRSLIALEMEAYGVARAAAMSIERPLCIIIKGVQDFADQGKNDSVRDYAAYASASILKELLVRYWDNFTVRR